MPPLHGSRVLPAARLTIARGRMAGRAADGWTVARHVARALAVSVALAGIGVPAALLASQAPAAAATGKQLTQGQVSIAITGMTPQVAGPGATITVTGTVTNSSRQPVSGLSVELLASSTQVTSAELQAGSAAQAELASGEVQQGIWNSARPLQPGGKDPWTIRVTAKSIGMTRFGVYPLTAQAQTTLGQLAAATTYLPYVPAKKGPYGSSIPARAKISWVLPLIDKPLLDKPWQANCKGAEAQALAQSLGSQGRLGELVGAGAGSMGTADAYSAATGSRQAAQNRAVSSEPAQSLSGFDGVTWAIDPALLANVKALAECGAAQPSWARVAKSWLTHLSQVTSAEPVFVTPYGDPDVAAIASHNTAPDLQSSFQLGQQISQRILRRNVGSGIAWPADGIAGYSTVNYLAGSEKIQTLLLSSTALRNPPSAVVRVANGFGSYMNLLLANASLTQLLAVRHNSPVSAFSTAQDFLAQTALAAQQDPGSPIIVAPPRRWDPPAGLAADVLSDTASASWLSPVSLTSLTAGAHIPSVRESRLVKSRPGISRQELGKLTRLDSKKNQLEAIAARPDNSLSLAVATVESSAWQGRSSHTALRMLAFVRHVIGRQEREVQIFAEPRVTLGGLKGSVPVSIDNRLGYEVKVKLELHSQSPGVKITASPGPVVTIPAHSAQAVKLHVQATQVGSTTITMSLENKYSQPLPAAQVPMTVEATQVGVLGVIICAAALGIFLLAYTARAVRRGRPGSGADHPVDHGLAADQDGDQSTEPAEPDTVMAERTWHGAAGAPGP